jgi:hypothetical protein
MSENVDKMLIYISSPYSAPTLRDRVKNVYKAIDAGIEVMRKGHFPIIPVLMHYFDLRATKEGIIFSWENYMAHDLKLLSRCDALLSLGSSRGCDIEFKYALDLELPIFYSVEEI